MANKSDKKRARVTRGDRFVFGDRFSFAPEGKPRQIGRPNDKPLGEVVEYGPAQSVTLFVGANRGDDKRNQRGFCAKQPAEFDAEQIDAEFRRAREAQVGRKNVGATAVSGRGLFRGDEEKSVAYEVAYIPNEKEPTYEQFRQHMDTLAETMSRRLCQDEVLIIRDDGDTRSAAGARWEEDDDE